MSCAHDETLVLYLDGELAPAERHAFEAHLASCAACSEARQAIESLDALLAIDDPVSTRLRARLESIPAVVRPVAAWTRLAAAAAVLVALGVLAFQLLSTSEPGAPRIHRPTIPVASTLPPTFAERVEASLRSDTVDDRAWLDEVAPRALGDVLGLVDGDDNALARAAVRQLGRWGRIEALPVLRGALRQPHLARTAIVAVGRVGTDAGVAAVAGFLGDAGQADLARRALVEIGGPAAARCLARAHAVDPDPALLDALAEVGGATAARVLTARIAQGADADRSALRAMRRGGPSLLRDAVALASGPDDVAARDALRVLEAMRPVDAVDALAPLLAHRSRRFAAARVLARIDSEASAQALLNAPRAYELEPLFRLAGPGAEGLLLRDLKAGARRERTRAARLLAFCGGPLAVEALAEATTDRALAPRVIASIGQTGAEGAVAALKRLAADSRLRLDVIAALGATERREAVPVLRALAAAHPSVRARVVQALSHISAPEAVESIVVLDGRRRLRSQSTRALASMEPALVRRTLVAMLDSTHGASARHALSSVSPGPARSSRYASAP